MVGWIQWRGGMGSVARVGCCGWGGGGSGCGVL